MAVKSDRWIVEMSAKGMIEPFAESQVRLGISFGVSSYGYDFRLADEFQLLSPDFRGELDPKRTDGSQFVTTTGPSVVIPPNSYILGRSREYFRIPRDIITICFGKSTYARSGVIVNVTPFEPEWEGFATLSLANTSRWPVRVYADEGIAQLLFLEASEVCQVSYKDKKGKYQGQKTITPSKADT